MNALHNFTIGARLNENVKRVELGTETLRRLAPSIFADGQHESRSARYSHVPTVSVIDALRDSGWFPTAAREQKVRDQGRAGFQKHEIRFANRETLNGGLSALRVGDSIVEVVLTNSSDGSSAYQVEAGLFRFACSNGLMVCDSMFQKVAIKHQGFNPQAVIDVSAEIVNEAPALAGVISGWQGLELAEDERLAFARSALMLRHDLDSVEEIATKSPISPEMILDPRRREDQGRDLWSTLNVIQENAIKGGQKDYRRRKPAPEGRRLGARFPKTRAVQSIDGDQKLNRALFHLAESMAAIKTGAGMAA